MLFVWRELMRRFRHGLWARGIFMEAAAMFGGHVRPVAHSQSKVQRYKYNKM